MQEREYVSMSLLEQTHWWFVSKRLFFEKILNRCGIVKGGGLVILDVGAGTGGAISFLSKFGKVIGIEPNKMGRTLALNRGIHLRNATAEKTKMKSESCDLVCFFDVLYHQNIHERKVLSEALRILKPNGLLLVSDCAFPFLMSPHDKVFGAARRYTISTLSQPIKSVGFSIRYSTYAFFVLFPIFLAWRGFQVIKSRLNIDSQLQSDVSDVPVWLNIILRILCAIESLGYGWMRYPWGSSVIILAQKTK